MSKAEALKAYCDNCRYRGNCAYLNRGMESKCLELDTYSSGYEQAEEDLALTWKDMVLFRELFDATDANIRSGSIKIQPMTKEYYQEVLKRFKERK